MYIVLNKIKGSNTREWSKTSIKSQIKTWRNNIRKLRCITGSRSKSTTKRLHSLHHSIFSLLWTNG